MPLGKPLLDALDRMGYGGIVLDAPGNVLRINTTATRLLKENAPCANGSAGSTWEQPLRALLKSSATSYTTAQDGSRLVIRRDALGQRPLVVHLVPIEQPVASGPHTVVILVDLHATPRACPETLQAIFGLTPTEAKLASAVASGKSLDEVADAGRVTITTVRKQLASVFAKTYTHRQAELVALLVSVAILP